MQSDSPPPGVERWWVIRTALSSVAGFLRWSKKPLMVFVSLSVIFLVWADFRVGGAGGLPVFDDLASTPRCDAALVLGTSKYAPSGRPNVYYQSRLKAAAELFKAGKVRAVVVSGDNRTLKYNEPQKMKEDLVDLGVPAEFVTCDYAGFRTLDSVVRMKAVFGVERYVVVSQDFHVARALYIARAYGQSPVGFAARIDGQVTFKTRFREVFARALAMLDINVFKREPKFLGEPVRVNLAGEPGGAGVQIQPVAPR